MYHLLTQSTFMKKNFNMFMLMTIMSLGAMMITSSCSKEEAFENSSEDQPTHHVGLYTLSKDLVEIYDAKVEAICNGKVVNTIDLKMIEAYAEDDETVSYNVDLYTEKPVEYKLSFSCCKELDELNDTRNYDLGFVANFVKAQRSPEKALKTLKARANCMTQTIDGLILRSYYGAGSEYKGKTFYAVYAIVNTGSYKMTD